MQMFWVFFFALLDLNICWKRALEVGLPHIASSHNVNWKRHLKTLLSKFFFVENGLTMPLILWVLWNKEVWSIIPRRNRPIEINLAWMPSLYKCHWHQLCGVSDCLFMVFWFFCFALLYIGRSGSITWAKWDFHVTLLCCKVKLHLWCKLSY